MNPRIVRCEALGKMGCISLSAWGRAGASLVAEEVVTPPPAPQIQSRKISQWEREEKPRQRLVDSSTAPDSFRQLDLRLLWSEHAVAHACARARARAPSTIISAETLDDPQGPCTDTKTIDQKDSG